MFYREKQVQSVVVVFVVVVVVVVVFVKFCITLCINFSRDLTKSK